MTNPLIKITDVSASFINKTNIMPEPWGSIAFYGTSVIVISPFVVLLWYIAEYHEGMLNVASILVGVPALIAYLMAIVVFVKYRDEDGKSMSYVEVKVTNTGDVYVEGRCITNAANKAQIRYPIETIFCEPEEVRQTLKQKGYDKHIKNIDDPTYMEPT